MRTCLPDIWRRAAVLQRLDEFTFGSHLLPWLVATQIRLVLLRLLKNNLKIKSPSSEPGLPCLAWQQHRLFYQTISRIFPALGQHIQWHFDLRIALRIFNVEGWTSGMVVCGNGRLREGKCKFFSFKFLLELQCNSSLTKFFNLRTEIRHSAPAPDTPPPTWV